MDEFDRCRGSAPTERATNYLFYDYYDYLVRPELRPLGDTAGETALRVTIQKTRQRLAELRVLTNLSPAQQDALAALVVDFTARAEMFASFEKMVALARDVPKLLGGHTKQKLATLQKKLAEIRDSLASIRHPLVEREQLGAAVQALNDFDRLTPFGSGKAAEAFVEFLRTDHPQADDPTSAATCQIYWFLVCKCGCSHKEAELRTAMIGNDCFGWNVVCHCDGSERGSVTIRQRIKRTCPSQR